MTHRQALQYLRDHGLPLGPFASTTVSIDHTGAETFDGTATWRYHRRGADCRNAREVAELACEDDDFLVVCGRCHNPVAWLAWSRALCVYVALAVAEALLDRLEAVAPLDRLDQVTPVDAGRALQCLGILASRFARTEMFSADHTNSADFDLAAATRLAAELDEVLGQRDPDLETVLRHAPAHLDDVVTRYAAYTSVGAAMTLLRVTDQRGRLDAISRDPVWVVNYTRIQTVTRNPSDDDQTELWFSALAAELPVRAIESGFLVAEAPGDLYPRLGLSPGTVCPVIPGVDREVLEHALRVFEWPSGPRARTLADEVRAVTHALA